MEFQLLAISFFTITDGSLLNSQENQIYLLIFVHGIGWITTIVSLTINTENRNSDQTNQKTCRRFLKLYQENPKILPAWSDLTHATFKLHPAPTQKGPIRGISFFIGKCGSGEETYHLLERSPCWQQSGSTKQ